MNLLGQYQSYVITAALAAASAAYTLFVFLPGKREIDELELVAQTKEDFILTANSLDASLARARTELAQLQAFTGLWRRETPGIDEVAPVYGAITQQAKLAGAKTMRFEPQPPEHHASLSLFPVVVGVQGKFHQLCDLIVRLESMPGTLWIDRIHMEPSLREGEILACEVRLAIFAEHIEKSNEADRSGGR